MKIDSAYVAVSDRKRAEAFWGKVFQLEPCMSNGSFTFFDVDGFLFGLFDPAATSESIQTGNHCVVCIHVKDADVECSRLEAFASIAMPIHSVGPYRVFQIEDSERNVVEFYSGAEHG
jgi:predicted enzyme related to lactoylglutathione lyase